MPEDKPENNPLKEYLKIIKDYHRVLLLLSATILLFALSPDETKVYKNSLAELKAFMQYGESKKITGYLNYLDMVAGQKAEQLKIIETIKEVVGKKGITGIVYLNEDVITQDKKGIKLLADLQGLDEDKLEQTATGTIAEVGQKLSNYSNFYLFEPNTTDLKENLIKLGFLDTIAKGYVLVDSDWRMKRMELRINPVH